MAYNLKRLKKLKKAELINMVYNNWIGDYCDTPFNDDEGIENGKRIPYIGWYWRNIDVMEKDIRVGITTEGYKGIMENNKWDYGERRLTPEECDTFTGFIDKAIDEYSRGGSLDALIKSRDSVFKEIRDWIQTLEIPSREETFDYYD